MQDIGTPDIRDYFDDIRKRAQANIDSFGWLDTASPDAVMQVVTASMELGVIIRDLATALSDR
jgi:hypothetical protein